MQLGLRTGHSQLPDRLMGRSALAYTDAHVGSESDQHLHQDDSLAIGHVITEYEEGCWHKGSRREEPVTISQ